MKNIKFGYARVSSKEQNEGRQIEALKAEGVDERYIYIDKKSGKDFKREKYIAMIDRLREGDIIVIASIDRLGRDYNEILEQWKYITQTIKANVKVLDMPLLDTSANTQSLDTRFVADLVLQILSYVANKERELNKRRQRQGIDIMPIIDGKRVSLKTGKPAGRPKMEKPEQWDEIYQKWVNKEITAVAAMKVLGLKNCKFYYLVKEERERI
jgi:DNA invertase Pin-like site-specific DNA recombinase